MLTDCGPSPALSPFGNGVSRYSHGSHLAPGTYSPKGTRWHLSYRPTAFPWRSVNKPLLNRRIPSAVSRIVSMPNKQGTPSDATVDSTVRRLLAASSSGRDSLCDELPSPSSGRYHV